VSQPGSDPGCIAFAAQGEFKMKMNKLVVCSLSLLALAVTVRAQSTVTTTGGTANQITKFSGSKTVVNSTITEANGKVGIGNSAPTEALSVSGNVDVGGSGSLKLGGSTRINSSGTILGGAGHANTPGITFATDPGTGLFKPATGTLGFVTGGVERMQLNPNGFLGIGTLSPASPLTVTGVIQSTSGGFKFPDGSVQTKAAAGAGAVVHDTTLKGAGSTASPLAVADPFVISDDVIGTGAAITGQVFQPGAIGIVADGPGTAMKATGGNIGISATGHTAIVGTSNVAGGNGVEGIASNGSAGDFGIFGVSSTGKAGFFSGDVQVTGTLSKAGGSFKIDDPADPENKFLSHSFVESPDMMNIYNGNIVTDQRGVAAVTMPGYFSALNRDFRYQLTAIGQLAQAAVVRELENNEFMIQTDKPGVKVSWQVTGIRHDAWANAHRIPVEEEKAVNERGHFIHPELFDHPEADRVLYVSRPDLKGRLK
jgi:trimeric autotransporter adhesin